MSPRNLSNVTATIDGQNAPILYVSSNQIHRSRCLYESTLGGGESRVVVSNGCCESTRHKYGDHRG